MKLGYDLTIKQTQKLALTPELIQAIQILQFSNQELESYVQEQLLINPVIETAGEKPAEEFELPDPERVTDSYRGEYRREEKQQYPYEQHAANDVTLVEHLMFQLQFAPLCEAQRKTGKYIIESLDDNGYLTQSRSELAESLDLQPEEIEKVLAVIHTFDPAGVGAENLRECLLVQLAAQDRLTELKQRVISDFLEDMASNRLAVIARKLGTETEQIQKIADEIRTLDPRAGQSVCIAGRNQIYNSRCIRRKGRRGVSRYNQRGQHTAPYGQLLLQTGAEGERKRQKPCGVSQ